MDDEGRMRLSLTRSYGNASLVSMREKFTGRFPRKYSDMQANGWGGDVIIKKTPSENVVTAQDSSPVHPSVQSGPPLVRRVSTLKPCLTGPLRSSPVGYFSFGAKAAPLGQAPGPRIARVASLTEKSVSAVVVIRSIPFTLQ